MPDADQNPTPEYPLDPVSILLGHEGTGTGTAPRVGAMRQFRSGLGPVGTTALVILAGLAAAQNFDNGAFGVLAPEIRHSFHLNNAGIDAVSGLTAALPLLGSVFVGNLGDRGDRVKISRYSALLWGVTAILTGVAPVLAILVIARLLGGIGLLASGTIYPSLLSDYYPVKKRAQVLTVFLLASTGIGLVASPLAGAIGDAFGWRAAFVVLALPTFILAFMLRLLREPKHLATDAADAVVTVAADGALVAPGPVAGTMRESFRIIRKAKTMRRVWVAAFIIGGAAAPMSTLISTFIKDVYHVGSFGRGAIISAVGVGGIIGMIAGGALTQRMLTARRARTLPLIAGLSAVLLSAFILIFALVPTLWMAVVAISLAGIGLGGFLTPYTTIVSLVTPTHLRSQAYAWSTVYFAFGAIFVSIFVGTLADSAGQRAALALLSGVLAVGSMVAVTARRFVDADTLEQVDDAPGMPGMTL
jgi:MFS transporter, Spinster family, sphingosine-1-phosphate transporter